MFEFVHARKNPNSSVLHLLNHEFLTITDIDAWLKLAFQFPSLQVVSTAVAGGQPMYGFNTSDGFVVTLCLIERLDIIGGQYAVVDA